MKCLQTRIIRYYTHCAYKVHGTHKKSIDIYVQACTKTDADCKSRVWMNQNNSQILWASPLIGTEGVSAHGIMCNQFVYTHIITKHLDTNNPGLLNTCNIYLCQDFIWKTSIQSQQVLGPLMYRIEGKRITTSIYDLVISLHYHITKFQNNITPSLSKTFQLNYK